MMIKEWLPAFLERHKHRNPRTDWPTPDWPDGKELAKSFMNAFIDSKVRKAEADAASLKVADDDDRPQFIEDHLPAIMAAIERHRAKLAEASDKAKPVKKTTPQPIGKCQRCSNGFAAIFHPDYNGSRVLAVTDRDGIQKFIPAVIASHCVCPIGRWKRERVKDEDRARVPDLQDVLDGKLKWLTEDPTVIATMAEGIELWKQFRNRPDELPAGINHVPGSTEQIKVFSPKEELRREANWSQEEICNADYDPPF